MDMASKQTDEDEPLFNFKTKSAQEQYDFMIQKSESARICRDAYNAKDQFRHAAFLIELVKIGYTREEIYSFLRILYGDGK